MVVDYIVEFKSLPPSHEEILQRIRENTGLYVTMNERKDTLIHPIENEKISFYTEDHSIIIIMGHLKMFYLLGATLGALVDMGGSCNFAIPDWTRKKWQGKSLFRLLWK